MVWGTGHLTWEWEQGLRSSTIPSLYAALFLLLKLLHLDYQWLVVLAPRVITGALTAVGDWALLRMVRSVHHTTPPPHYTTTPLPGEEEGGEGGGGLAPPPPGD